MHTHTHTHTHRSPVIRMQLPSLFSGGGSGGGGFLAEGTGMKPPIDPHDSVSILSNSYISALVPLYICSYSDRRMRSGYMFLSSNHYLRASHRCIHVLLILTYVCAFRRCMRWRRTVSSLFGA